LKIKNNPEISSKETGGRPVNSQKRIWAADVPTYHNLEISEASGKRLSAMVFKQANE